MSVYGQAPDPQVARAQEQAAAERDRIDAIYSRCKAAWAAAGSPVEPDFEWHSLREIFEENGTFFRCGQPDEITNVLDWVTDWPDADADMRWLADRWQRSFVRCAQPWAIVRDTEAVVPPGLSGARLAAWAADWRDRIQGLCGAELVVYASPGQHPVFVTWWPAPLERQHVSAWCSRLEPPTDDVGRFQPIKYKNEEWEASCGPTYLPAAGAPSPAARAGHVPASRLVTGIAALDGMFRGGVGIPFGTRLLVCGDPQNCKTQMLLELAEAASAAGWHVLWVSIDDDPDLITIRRLQRLGLDDERAGRLEPADVARLDPRVQVLNDRPLESAWEAVHAEANGARLLVLADSMQAGGLCAAAEGKSDRVAIEAAIGAIIDCQRRWPATFVATSEVTAASVPKGSRDLEYKFDVRLSLKLAGEKLAISVVKNKPGRLGSFELFADFGGQRLVDAKAAAEAKADAIVWGPLRALVAELGEASGRELERRLGAAGVGSRDGVRRCIGRHLERDLIEGKKGYRLRG